jgi:hypothetical protein
MLADHDWLANPAAPLLPSDDVRARIMDAARAPRVPRISGVARRPVAVIGAAFAVVAVIGGGILVAGQRGSGIGSAPTMTAPASAQGTAPAASAPTSAASSITAGPCAPRPAGLTAWWQGEDRREVVAGRDLELRGGAAPVPGLVGQALSFNGVTAYAAVAHDPALDLGTGDFTIMLWVRFVEVSGQHVIIEQTAGQAGWSFVMGDQTLWFLVVNGDVAAATTGAAVVADAWYHVAVRRSGGELVIFRNGKPLRRQTFEAPADLTADAPLLLGRRNSDIGLLLDGQLDEVQLVVGHALFETDIAAIYRAGQTGFCVP